MTTTPATSVTKTGIILTLMAAYGFVSLGCGNSSSAAASGGTDAGGTSQSSGGASSSSGGASSSGGKGASGGSSTSSGGGGDGKAYSGLIDVSQTNTKGAYSGGFAAKFTKNQVIPAGTPMCTQATSGSCTFFDCTAALAADAGAPQTIYAQAGTVSISGGKAASATELTYSTLPGINGYSATTTSQVFSPGDTFTITATGQDVAAFTAKSGPAPADITLTAPAAAQTIAGNQYTIDESKDLNVTWTGGSAGTQVQVLLYNTGYVDCTFDAAAETGTVPATLLTKLGPADGTVSSSAIFEVIPQSTVKVDVSNVDLQFVVQGTNISGTFKTP